MNNQEPPRDDDPSDMTDFEKNTTFEELEQVEVDRENPVPDHRSQDDTPHPVSPVPPPRP